jgi:hypothetical protein
VFECFFLFFLWVFGWVFGIDASGLGFAFIARYELVLGFLDTCMGIDVLIDNDVHICLRTCLLLSEILLQIKYKLH